MASFLVALTSRAQSSLDDELALLDAELDELFGNQSDSLSLVALINQVINTDPNYSELQIRAAYSNRVTTAGRDFGIDQQGIIPGLTYYHKSGMFADVSGFWNSALDPKYNLTVGTIGYQNQWGKRTSYSLSYDRSFYTNPDSLHSLNNALNASASFYFNKFYTGVNYSFSFGTETAHRIMTNLTGRFNLGKVGMFDKIMVLPSASLLFGTANVVNQYTRAPLEERIDQISEEDIRRYAQRQGISYERALRQFERLQNRIENRTEEDVRLLQTFYETSETFDLLNYYLTLPVALHKGRVTLILSYNYNIPRNLSDDVTYEPNGYFGFSLVYSLRL